MMIIDLSQLSGTLKGIYPLVGPKKDQPNRTDTGRMGSKQLFLHPDAAASVMQMLADGVYARWSDILRSAMGSLNAMATKKGVQPPSRSGHNYGFSFDLDIDDVMHVAGLSKQALDDLMGKYGWYCHRKDHLIESEAWHYNFFGDAVEEYLNACGPTSTSLGLEHKIQKFYGAQMHLTPSEVNEALRKLKYDDLGSFQHKLRLPATGKADDTTLRTLAYCASTQNILPIPGMTVAVDQSVYGLGPVVEEEDEGLGPFFGPRG